MANTSTLASLCACSYLIKTLDYLEIKLVSCHITANQAGKEQTKSECIIPEYYGTLAINIDQFGCDNSEASFYCAKLDYCLATPN